MQRACLRHRTDTSYRRDTSYTRTMKSGQTYHCTYRLDTPYVSPDPGSNTRRHTAFVPMSLHCNSCQGHMVWQSWNPPDNSGRLRRYAARTFRSDNTCRPDTVQFRSASYNKTRLRTRYDRMIPLDSTRPCYRQAACRFHQDSICQPDIRSSRRQSLGNNTTGDTFPLELTRPDSLFLDHTSQTLNSSDNMHRPDIYMVPHSLHRSTSRRSDTVSMFPAIPDLERALLLSLYRSLQNLRDMFRRRMECLDCLPGVQSMKVSETRDSEA